MSILVYRNAALAGAAASTLLAAQIIEKPGSTLGFDYDPTLIPTYRALIQMTEDGLLDWSDVRAFILSEQAQVGAGYSIYQALCENFLDKVEQLQENRYVPDPAKGDWSLVCNDFENEILMAGGLDVAFLAVHGDGSLAFNPGGSELAPVTHVEHTAEGRVVTAGLTTLMAARKLVVLMVGADKAEIAPSIFHGPIDPGVPASLLQLHGNAVFVLDEEAAAHL